jgi:predicted patatin/cPLA2 family phospholipase
MRNKKITLDYKEYQDLLKQIEEAEKEYKKIEKIMEKMFLWFHITHGRNSHATLMVQNSILRKRYKKEYNRLSFVK